MTRLRTAGLDNITGQHKFFSTSSVDSIMGAPQLSTVETDFGTTPLYSGSFDITGSNFIVGRTVIVTQAPGPYTGKGTLEDEAEMDMVLATAFVKDSTTITAFWFCPPKGGPMVGNVKFNYQIITQQ